MTSNPQVGSVQDDGHRTELPVHLMDLHDDVRARLALADEAVGLAMLVRDLRFTDGSRHAFHAVQDCAAIILGKAGAS